MHKPPHTATQSLEGAVRRVRAATEVSFYPVGDQVSFTHESLKLNGWRIVKSQTDWRVVKQNSQTGWRDVKYQTSCQVAKVRLAGCLQKDCRQTLRISQNYLAQNTVDPLLV